MRGRRMGSRARDHTRLATGSSSANDAGTDNRKALGLTRPSRAPLRGPAATLRRTIHQAGCRTLSSGDPTLLLAVDDALSASGVPSVPRRGSFGVLEAGECGPTRFRRGTAHAP